MLLTKEQVENYTEEFKDGAYEFIHNSVSEPTREEVINTFLDVLTENLNDDEYEKIILETCHRLKGSCEEKLE